jgi:hypothetical protein
VYLALQCSTGYLISTYDITSGTFAYYDVETNFFINDFGIHSSNIYFLGTDFTNRGISLSNMIDGLLISNQHLTVSTSTFEFELDTLSTFPMITGSTVTSTTVIKTLTGIADSGSRPVSLTNAFIVDEVIYYTQSLTYTGLSANETKSESFYFTWINGAGTTIIAYSLIQNGSEAVPTWVTLDSSNQLLNFTTPSPGSITTYTFQILSTVSGTELVYRTVSITVNAAATAAVDANANAEVDVEDEYSEQEVEILQIAASTSIGAAFLMSVVYSAISQTNPQAFWSMINQFQLYILLPTVDPDIPDKIIDFLEGLGFWLFNFNFVKVDNFIVYREVEEFFACEDEDDEYLSSIGIESTWSLLNNLQMVFVMFIVIIFHLLFFFIYYQFRNSQSKTGKVVKYIFMLLTFTLYIRMMIESYIILLLSSASEVYNMRFDSYKSVLSFMISVLIIVVQLLLLFASYIVARRAAKNDYEPKHTFLSEIVTGTKEKFGGRMMLFLHLLRIFISVTWIVCSKELPIFFISGVFTIIQVCFACFKTYLRPFEEIKENIIEILNDWIYVFACLMIWGHYSSDWSYKSQNTLMGVMAANSFLITIILFVFLIILIIKCWKTNDNKVRPITNVTGEIIVNRFNLGDGSNMGDNRPVRKIKREESNNNGLVEESKSQRAPSQIDRYRASDVEVTQNDIILN